jgi:hypothetical protein
MLPHRAQAPDISAEQEGTLELVKRIRKLRWIGMDDEAARLQIQLELSRMEPTDGVIAMPRDID